MIVRRRRIWDDSINKVLLFEEESLKRLNVRFVGKMGADYGGPTREFFAILLQGAPILSGLENSHVFLRDAMRLDRREYEAFGRLVALALLHKCAGPHNLSRSLVDYIIDPENIVYNPNYIPDFEVRKLALQLMKCKTTESMNMLSELDDIRIDAGYNNAVVTIQDRDIIINKICKHNVITKQLEEIQQFTTGLNICGVLSALKKHKEEATKELTYHSCLLTADKIRSLFEIKYTEGASATEKTKEEDIFYHFANFLDELDNIASGKRNSWDVIDVSTEDDPQEVTKKDIT